jgi:hypothetical protein
MNEIEEKIKVIRKFFKCIYPKYHITKDQNKSLIFALYYDFKYNITPAPEEIEDYNQIRDFDIFLNVCTHYGAITNKNIDQIYQYAKEYLEKKGFL